MKTLVNSQGSKIRSIEIKPHESQDDIKLNGGSMILSTSTYSFDLPEIIEVRNVNVELGFKGLFGSSIHNSRSMISGFYSKQFYPLEYQINPTGTRKQQNQMRKIVNKQLKNKLGEVFGEVFLRQESIHRFNS